MFFESIPIFHSASKALLSLGFVGSVLMFLADILYVILCLIAPFLIVLGPVVILQCLMDKLKLSIATQEMVYDITAFLGAALLLGLSGAATMLMNRG